MHEALPLRQLYSFVDIFQRFTYFIPSLTFIDCLCMIFRIYETNKERGQLPTCTMNWMEFDRKWPWSQRSEKAQTSQWGKKFPGRNSISHSEVKVRHARYTRNWDHGYKKVRKPSVLKRNTNNLIVVSDSRSVRFSEVFRKMKKRHNSLLFISTDHMLSYSRKVPLFQKINVRQNQIHEENGFLCCSAMQFGENPTFRRNILSPRRVEEQAKQATSTSRRQSKLRVYQLEWRWELASHCTPIHCETCVLGRILLPPHSPWIWWLKWTPKYWRNFKIWHGSRNYKLLNTHKSVSTGRRVIRFITSSW
jgi:hypothetical protein